MDASLKSKIVDAFSALPVGCRNAPATDAELSAFESEFGVIPADLRWFLAKCGGGTVGSEWVDGISELRETHRKFRDECSVDNGWTIRGVFVIGWDASGNPFGIDDTSGKILLEDHNFGGVHEMADSFGAFLNGQLLA